MPTPVTSLAALTLVTPVLVPPTYTLSVDSSVLPITVNADAKTTSIEVSIYNTTRRQFRPPEPKRVRWPEAFLQ